MSEGLSHHQILNEHDRMHTLKKGKSAKQKVLNKHKFPLTGLTQKEQMGKSEENREHQKRFGRAWND